MDCSCGPQWADVGCHVLLQVPATMVAAQAVAHGEGVSLSRALDGSGTMTIQGCCKLSELWIVCWLWHLYVMYYGINDVFD